MKPLILILLATSLLAFKAFAQVDIQLKGKTPYPYLLTPSNHANASSLKAQLINLGEEVTTDISVTVTDDLQSLSGTRPVMAPFASADTQLVDFESFTPSLGKHTAVFQAIVDNDINLSNNSDTVSYEITSGKFCYTHFDTSRATGVYPFTGYSEIYQRYFALEDDNIMNVDAFLIKPSLGALIRPLIRTTDPDGVYRKHYGTAYRNLDTLNKVVHMRVGWPITAGPLDIGLAFGNYDPGLAVTTDNYQPGTTEIKDFEVNVTVPLDTNPSRYFNPYLLAYTRIGALEVSKTTIQSGINLYPNPTSDLVIIDTPNKIELDVFNIYGQSVDHFTFSGMFKYNMNELPAGTYLFQITDKGVLVTKKIIKL